MKIRQVLVSLGKNHLKDHFLSFIFIFKFSFCFCDDKGKELGRSLFAVPNSAPTAIPLINLKVHDIHVFDWLSTVYLD